MECSVGLMLILLSVLILTGAMKWISQNLSPAHPRATGAHAPLSEHDSHVHFHWHSHAPASEHHGDALTAPSCLRGPFERLGLFHALRPLFVGIVHGLAGSAAVALLVLSTIHDPKWAVLYLLIFGIGPIAGIMLLTSAPALPRYLAGSRLGLLDCGL